MVSHFSAFGKCLATALLIGGFVLAVLRPSVSAALEPGRYSESEKVGFAFHQLGKFEPDYESWIKNTDRYKALLPANQLGVMHKELTRLRSGYHNYIPDADLVSIEIEALIKSSNYFVQSQKKGELTDVTIDLIDLPENYFPFQVGDTWIALVIKDFDLLNQHTFSAEDYRAFAKTLGLTAAYQLSQKVSIDLKLRPLSVDTSSPLSLDGLDMWLMLAEIGEMTVWRKVNRDKQVLWTYSAPWYVSDKQKELLLLYQE